MPDAKATFAIVGQDQTAAAFASAMAGTEAFAAKASSLLKGMFAIGGLGLAADFIKSTAELGHNLEEGAQRAGIAQGTFNQLASAFDEAGVSADSLSRGIKNMQVALSKATNGDDPLAAAFNEIGLSAASLKQQAPDVQLLAIAEAISKIPDPADRARIGAQLMGKQFLELEPILSKGAQGLDAFIKSASGISPEASKNLSDFFDVLQHAWNGFKSYEAFFIGDIGQLATGLKGMFTPDLEARIRAVQSALAMPGNFTPERLAQMRDQLAALQAQADKLATTPKAPNVKSALSEQGKGDYEASLQANLKASLEATVAEEDMDSKAAAARTALLDQELKATMTAGERRVTFEAQVDDLITAGRITAYEGFKRIYAQDQAASNANADEVAKATNSGAIEAAIQATQKQFSESADAMAAKSKLMTESMAEDWNKTKNNAMQAASAIEDSFATFLVDPFDGGLKKMLTAWIQTIDQMVAKAAAQSIFKSLFPDSGGLGGLLQSFLGGGGTNPGAGLGEDAFSTYAGLGLATGGSWKVGGSGGEDSQLVRFRASPNEKVTVSRPGQGTDSGVTIHQTVNIDSRTDSAQIGQLIQQSTQYAINQSVARVSDMSRRGRFGTNS